MYYFERYDKFDDREGPDIFLPILANIFMEEEDFYKHEFMDKFSKNNHEIIEYQIKDFAKEFDVDVNNVFKNLVLGENLPDKFLQTIENNVKLPFQTNCNYNIPKEDIPEEIVQSFIVAEVVIDGVVYNKEKLIGVSGKTYGVVNKSVNSSDNLLGINQQLDYTTGSYIGLEFLYNDHFVKDKPLSFDYHLPNYELFGDKPKELLEQGKDYILLCGFPFDIEIFKYDGIELPPFSVDVYYVTKDEKIEINDGRTLSNHNCLIEAQNIYTSLVRHNEKYLDIRNNVTMANPNRNDLSPFYRNIQGRNEFYLDAKGLAAVNKIIKSEFNNEYPDMNISIRKRVRGYSDIVNIKLDLLSDNVISLEEFKEKWNTPDVLRTTDKYGVYSNRFDEEQTKYLSNPDEYIKEKYIHHVKTANDCILNNQTKEAVKFLNTAYDSFNHDYSSVELDFFDTGFYVNINLDNKISNDDLDKLLEVKEVDKDKIHQHEKEKIKKDSYTPIDKVFDDCKSKNLLEPTSSDYIVITRSISKPYLSHDNQYNTNQEKVYLPYDMCPNLTNNSNQDNYYSVTAYNKNQPIYFKSLDGEINIDILPDNNTIYDSQGTYSTNYEQVDKAKVNNKEKEEYDK